MQSKSFRVDLYCSSDFLTLEVNGTWGHNGLQCKNILFTLHQ